MSLQANPTRDSPAVVEALRRARHLGRPVLASWTRPASASDAIEFFAQAAGVEDRLLWLRPSSGEALVGIGSARALTGHGIDRFKQVSHAWQKLLGDAVSEDGFAQAGGGPLLLGGFSFDPLRQSSTLWDGFPCARMVLPERMLAQRRGSAWLTTNVVIDPEPASQAAVSDPPKEPDEAPPMLSPRAWTALVGSVARGIRHGQLGLEKVVLARAEQLEADQAVDPAIVLRNLTAAYPGCTVFAVGHREACFLGATPERLISLHGGSASTMALAGSIARGATPREDQQLADRLLRDPKERAEHAVVVGALRDGLAQVCTRIVADAEPRVHKLQNVQHLLTPLRGQVTAGRGVLDLVERLHPTPAVGGFPRQPALELIRAFEGLDRGWYAGPIGWLNRDGEGDFVVGLRSALVRGASATLFAGCGIVADSNAAAEYTESGWKLRPMRAALGVDA
jgi:isochorismate synthase